MEYEEMSLDLRQEVTEAAVMESLAENNVIREYYKNNSGQIHEPVTLQTILAYADTANKNDNPHIQILRDYFENGVGKGQDPSQYVIQDFNHVSDYNGTTVDWGTSLMVTTPGSNGKPGVYVAYRGTGKDEWEENAQSLYQESTPQQRDARDYFDSLVERFEDEYFINGDVHVVGHSKGGNKATYVTLTSRYGKYIDSCLSLDGQGYSPEAIERFQEIPDYDDRCAKITQVSGKYDYVHALGQSVVPEENQYYVDTQPGQLIEGTSAGDTFYSLHLMEFLFQRKIVVDENGKKTYQFSSTLQEEVAPDEMVLSEKAFMEEYMKLSPEQRKQTAHTVMQLFKINLSPDGNHVDPDWIMVLHAIANDPEGTKDVLRNALNVVDPALKKKLETALALYSAWDILSLPKSSLGLLLGLLLQVALLSGKLSGKLEELQQKKMEREAAREAEQNPEFYINPELLEQYTGSDGHGRIGAYIELLQRDLTKIVNEAVPEQSFLATGGRAGEFDPVELVRFQHLKSDIATKRKEIHDLQDDVKAAVEHLEQIIQTLNAVIGYMSDTANQFINLENHMTDTVQGWSDIVMRS